MLIGTSTHAGAFTEGIVKDMAAHVDRPIIMPLSNPTSMCEAVPADLLAWTDGRALVATGSPFAPVTHNGPTYRIPQSNNALIFPGLGLGVTVARATRITDSMISAASDRRRRTGRPHHPGRTPAPAHGRPAHRRRRRRHRGGHRRRRRRRRPHHRRPPRPTGHRRHVAASTTPPWTSSTPNDPSPPTPKLRSPASPVTGSRVRPEDRATMQDRLTHHSELGLATGRRVPRQEH